MNAMDFPTPDQSTAAAGITSQMAAERARPVVLHNSGIVCWLTISFGICSMFLGLCMMLMVFSLIFPVSALSMTRVLAAIQWGFGGLTMCVLCPYLWQWGLRMIHSKVKLDERGVDFNLGTKKKPEELFMGWEQITSVQQKRVGNAREFTILGTDGSSAIFTSYTFFRPGKVAGMIAERAGLTIEKS